MSPFMIAEQQGSTSTFMASEPSVGGNAATEQKTIHMERKTLAAEDEPSDARRNVETTKKATMIEEPVMTDGGVISPESNSEESSSSYEDSSESESVGWNTSSEYDSETTSSGDTREPRSLEAAQQESVQETVISAECSMQEEQKKIRVADGGRLVGDTKEKRRTAVELMTH